MSELNEIISQIPFGSVCTSAVTWMLKMATTYKFFKKKRNMIKNRSGEIQNILARQKDLLMNVGLKDLKEKIFFLIAFLRPMLSWC